MSRACRSTGIEEILDPGWAAQQSLHSPGLTQQQILDSWSPVLYQLPSHHTQKWHGVVSHRVPAGQEHALFPWRNHLWKCTEVKSWSCSFPVTQEDCDPFELNSYQIKNEIWREVQIVPFVGATAKSLSCWPTFYSNRANRKLGIVKKKCNQNNVKQWWRESKREKWSFIGTSTYWEEKRQPDKKRVSEKNLIRKKKMLSLLLIILSENYRNHEEVFLKELISVLSPPWSERSTSVLFLPITSFISCGLTSLVRGKEHVEFSPFVFAVGKGWLDGVSRSGGTALLCPSPAEWLQPSLAPSLYLCFPLDHSRASSAGWVLAHQRNSWISEISSHLLEGHEMKSGQEHHNSPVYHVLFSSTKEIPGVLPPTSSLLQHWKYFMYNPVN